MQQSGFISNVYNANSADTFNKHIPLLLDHSLIGNNTIGRFFHHKKIHKMYLEKNNISSL